MATRNHDNLGKHAGKGPWPKDALMREFGFTIHSRPKDGPAIWTRGGRNYTEAEALTITLQEKHERERKLKEAMEEL